MLMRLSTTSCDRFLGHMFDVPRTRSSTYWQKCRLQAHQVISNRRKSTFRLTKKNLTSLTDRLLLKYVVHSIERAPEDRIKSYEMIHRRMANTRNLGAKTMRVRFGRDVKIYDVPHLKSFTSEQISRLWYQDEDYDRIDEENDHILISMARKDNQSCSSCCARGLEGLLPCRSRIRERTRQLLWDAVMDEQFHQWSIGIENREAIARVSREISAHPHTRIAQLRGLMDEMQALKLHSNSILDAITTKNDAKNNKKRMGHRNSCFTGLRKSRKDIAKKIHLVVAPTVASRPALPSKSSRRRSCLAIVPGKPCNLPQYGPSARSTKRALAYSWRRGDEHNCRSKFVGMTTTERKIVWES